jgi:transcriptional regulator with XRE-family HTH domain
VSAGDSLHKRLRDKEYGACFGKFIQNARQDAGMSQEALEEAAKVSAKTVSSIENAVRPPALTSLKAIAEALKLGSPAECQHCFEISEFYKPPVTAVDDDPLVPSRDIPADEMKLLRHYVAKWRFLPDPIRRGTIVLHEGESPYFEHFIRLISIGKHNVLAYIQFGKDQNFLAFNLPELYRALQQAVDEGRLVIEYIFLLPSREILKDPRADEFIGRYRKFAERIRLIFEDGPQTPKDLVGEHSIVLMTDSKVAFTHGRNNQGSMLQPTQHMSAAKFEELAAKYRKIRTGSEPHFERTSNKPQD